VVVAADVVVGAGVVVAADVVVGAGVPVVGGADAAAWAGAIMELMIGFDQALGKLSTVATPPITTVRTCLRSGCPVPLMKRRPHLERLFEMRCPTSINAQRVSTTLLS
jgi:hypothetical protein